MRHWGSAVGSWGVVQVCVGFDGFGEVVWVDFAGAAATAAHDGHELVAIGVALSLLFGFSSIGVIVALFAFLFAERPIFCGFLGSAILAGGFGGGVGFSYGVWGFVRPLDVFPPTLRWCHMSQISICKRSHGSHHMVSLVDCRKIPYNV